jgi:flagellin FlaB
MMNRNIRKDDKAFSGIEAAIVLIAFVVVAAVFSYVLIGAGSFVSQKASSAVYGSVGQTTTAMQVSGSVIGEDSTKSGKSIDTLLIWVENTAAGSPVDMTNMVMTFKSADETYTLVPSGSKEGKEMDSATAWKALYRAGKKPSTLGNEEWGVFKVSPGPGGDYDNLLELGEKMQLGVKLGGDNKGVLPNQKFTLELKPVGGSGGGIVYPITRRAPSYIDSVNELR